jgi:hypothetical protein
VTNANADDLDHRLRALADDIAVADRSVQDTLTRGRRRVRRLRAAATGLAIVLVAAGTAAVLRMRPEEPLTTVGITPGPPSSTVVVPVTESILVRDADGWERNCLRIALGAEATEGCLTPGTTLWKVGDRYVVVGYGAMVVDGVEYRAPKGEETLAPLRPGQSFASVEGDSSGHCLDTAVLDALAAHDPTARAYFGLSCGADVQFAVVLERPHQDPPHTTRTIVLERIDGRWTVHGEPTEQLCPTLPPPGPANCDHIVSQRRARTSTTTN